MENNNNNVIGHPWDPAWWCYLRLLKDNLKYYRRFDRVLYDSAISKTETLFYEALSEKKAS